MRTLLLALGGLLLSGCAATTTAGVPSWTSAPVPTVVAIAAMTRVIDVYKSPSCGCCHEWEAYLRRHGYTVNSIPTEDMVSVKADRAVPTNAQSCHTAVIGGYVVEGHVPVAAIEDLLRTAPAIDGIALPGMPPGSPGMPGEREGPFEVIALVDGTTMAFGTY